MEKTVGYIVMNRHQACSLSDYGDGVKVLTIGGRAVACFSTRDQARNAIRQTNRYAEREGLAWDRDHRILRLDAADV